MLDRRMRDVFAHAGFSFRVYPTPSDTGLRYDLVFALAGFSGVVSAPASITIVFISGVGSQCRPRSQDQVLIAAVHRLR